jgi:hypothetical protein
MCNTFSTPLLQASAQADLSPIDGSASHLLIFLVLQPLISSGCQLIMWSRQEISCSLWSLCPINFFQSSFLSFLHTWISWISPFCPSGTLFMASAWHSCGPHSSKDSPTGPCLSNRKRTQQQVRLCFGAVRNTGGGTGMRVEAQALPSRHLLPALLIPPGTKPSTGQR